MERNKYFRQIPKVDHVLMEEEVQTLCASYGKELVTEGIRQVLEELRMTISQGTEEEICQAFAYYPEKIRERAEQLQDFPLKRVINGTGILLHTNLGRAPLGKFQVEAAMAALTGYCNLEYNLDTGKRGKRWEHYRDLIARVTGSEGAIAINNNAAGVTLMLSTIAKGKQVIVSRGELIEIGGRFRIPEVMEQSGAVLKEVGTTNRTRISDYEKAITEETGALLKVHTSNYKILGFTEEASIEELVQLGKKYHLPVFVDLGSGVLINLEKYGLSHEPTVQEILKKGADMVCFSGDKLLGGPQAGILAGKQEYIARMEFHPLMRAFRLDKCTIAVLTATFREYLDEKRAMRNIPILWMLSRNLEELKEQAEDLARELIEFKGFQIMAEPSISMVGGGSLPTEEIQSYGLTIHPLEESCEALAERMRRLPVPIIAHIRNEKVWLDMRSVSEEEKETIKKELHTLFLADACGNRTHPGRD